MKIYPEKLAQQLKYDIKHAYFLSGDEALLISEAQLQIITAAKQQGFQERKVYHGMTNQDWESFYHDYQSLGLFNEKEIIDIRLHNNKFSDTAKKILTELLASPNPDKLLILSFPKIETATTKTKWFKALEANTTFIQFWPMEKDQFVRWLKARLQHQNLQLTSTALNLLTSLTEGNLLAAQQVIQQLHLLYGDGRLNEQDILKVVSDHSQTQLFQLADDILTGDGLRIAHGLNNLAAQGTDPILVLWLLSKEIRAYLSLFNAQMQQESLTKIFQRLQIWPKKQNAYHVIFKRHSTKSLMTLLQQAYQIDLMLEGILTTSVWDALKRLALALAGIKI